MASAFESANEILPLYDDIPKLLCYTNRVLQKCFSQCVDHLINNCPNKLSKFNKSPARYSANNEVSVLIEIFLVEMNARFNELILLLKNLNLSCGIWKQIFSDMQSYRLENCFIFCNALAIAARYFLWGSKLSKANAEMQKVGKENVLGSLQRSEGVWRTISWFFLQKKTARKAPQHDK